MTLCKPEALGFQIELEFTNITGGRGGGGEGTKDNNQLNKLADPPLPLPPSPCSQVTVPSLLSTLLPSLLHRMPIRLPRRMSIERNSDRDCSI